GQQQVDDLGLVDCRRVAAQQQLDVVVGDIVDALDGLADEGFDVRRVLADRRQQGFGSYLLGALDRDAVTEDRPLGRRLLTAVTLGQNQAVVEGLLAVGRSEEHTSELQSRENLVCRLLLEKKNKESD